MCFSTALVMRSRIYLLNHDPARRTQPRSGKRTAHFRTTPPFALPRSFAQGRHNVRIKRVPGLPLDLSQSSFTPHSGRYGFSVTSATYTCATATILASSGVSAPLGAQRIARPIPALVIRNADVSRHVQARISAAAEHLFCRQRMPHHKQTLLHAQWRAGLPDRFGSVSIPKSKRCAA